MINIINSLLQFFDEGLEERRKWPCNQFETRWLLTHDNNYHLLFIGWSHGSNINVTLNAVNVWLLINHYITLLLFWVIGGHRTSTWLLTFRRCLRRRMIELFKLIQWSWAKENQHNKEMMANWMKQPPDICQ